MVTLTSYYTTRFGELWEKSLTHLVSEAINGVLENAGLEAGQVDAVFFGNMLSGVLENNLNMTAQISSIMGTHAPVFRVEAACASGGMAVHLAQKYLQSGSAKTVLVLGAEKMNDYSPDEVTSALSAAASGEEQQAGLTFPGLYAMIANYYMNKYKLTEKSLAAVAYKNHFHATFNDKAHFQKKIEIDSILKSAYVAHPLKVLDASPISDGASAVILTTDPAIIKKSKHTVSLLACEVATDTIGLKDRQRIDEIAATKIASQKAFTAAGVTHKQIGVAEVHDCFTIAEILALEDLGFWKKGEGAVANKALTTMLGNGGSLIVNTSGGLKAGGHPVGATGVKQIGEIYLQLTQQAGKRQVKNLSYGLAHNVAGSGGAAVVSILGNK
jgi:acetyl-CoA C-acetyltransferase